jgi:hypothetical protein
MECVLKSYSEGFVADGTHYCPRCPRRDAAFSRTGSNDVSIHQEGFVMDCWVDQCPSVEGLSGLFFFNKL